MSTQHPVFFQQIPDRPLPHHANKAIERLMVILLHSKDRYLKFVFRFLQFHRFKEKPPYSFDVLHYYQTRLDPNTVLTTEETNLCTELQRMIDNSPTRDDLKKSMATLLEEFRAAKKRMTFGDQVYRNAEVVVNETPVDHSGFRTVDIGVDALDDKNFFEVVECKLRLDSFKEKDVQLRYYGAVLEEVRSVVGKESHLQFEMTVGYARPSRFKDVPLPHEFRTNGIRVVGVSVGDNIEELVLL